MAKRSGFFFASILGVISPNSKITTVKTTVLSVAAKDSLPYSKYTKSKVERDVAVMFTMLLPISTVESILS